MTDNVPLRILLAEDNPANQKLALHLLRRLGHQADVVENGLDVLEALLKQPYDVVLMDVQMPEMDGIEATRLIRQTAPGKQQPYIIAMTASALTEDRERCLSAGMNDYLRKPVALAELGEALRRCVPSTPTALPDAEPATPAVRDAILDPKVLTALLDSFYADEPKHLAQLLDLFLANTPELLASLRDAVRRDDAGLLQRAAHTLKSNSAMFGATVLAKMCKELEALAREGELTGAVQRLEQIEVEYRQVRAALGELRAAL